MFWIIIYNLFWPLGFALILLAGVLRGRLKRLASEMGPAMLPGRLGQSHADPNASVWIHGASLGEVRQLTGFLEHWRREWPSRRIHLSVMTFAALDWARKSLLTKGLVASVAPAPLDFWPCVALYGKTLPSVKTLILVETEIWPTLLFYASHRGLSVGLINGRVSEKTLEWWGWFSGFARRLMSYFDVICVSEERYRELIAPWVADSSRIVVTGNLKWDEAAPHSVAPPGALGRLRERIGISRQNLFWVAASSREGEEEIILRTFKRLAGRFEGLKLAIAPRHVERGLEILEMAKGHGLRVVLFSKLAQALGSAAVVVVDEFGILNDFYEAADVVFIGGTLVPRIGGHNFLEPASRAKPVVIGPYFDNFFEIGKEFLKQGALAVARNESELGNIVESWLRSPQERGAIGERARDLIERRRGAGQKTLAALEKV